MRNQNIYHVTVSQNHMATTFNFVVATEKKRIDLAKHLLKKGHVIVGNLESELSEFLIESPVYQLNQSKTGEEVTLSKNTAELLERSLLLEAKTRSVFSPLIKSKDENFGINWDSHHLKLSKKSEHTHLSFGAIGKGFALDKVRELLVQEDFNDFILSAGGSSIILSGFNNPIHAIPWTWGWSWMKDETGELLGIDFKHSLGSSVSIGVSGTFEKGNHIISKQKKTLNPEMLSALVATPSATDADALSTALFIEEKINPPWAENTPLALIKKENKSLWNSHFQSLWGSLTCLLLFSFQIIADETIDLGEPLLNQFTPYTVERNSFWILLPIFALTTVIIHLKNNKPKNLKPRIDFTFTELEKKQ